MGAQGSKNEESSFERGSTLSLSSKRRFSKVDETQSIAETINGIKTEIENYAGVRDDPRYVECQKILADLSGRLQELKSSGKKKSTARIGNLLEDIKVCFRLLEETVNRNEVGDHHLDMASIESHSFINQTVHKLDTTKKPELHGSVDSVLTSGGYNSKKEKPKSKPINTIDLLEQQIDNMEKDVKNAVEMEEKKQFIVLEKKIQILYTDLEMIQSDPHTPISERKENLEKRLIKYNNHIKKAKRSIDRRSTTNSLNIKSLSTTSSVDNAEPKVTKPTTPTTTTTTTNEIFDDIAKIEREIEQYHVKVNNYDGTKEDNEYKKMVELLEQSWSTVYNIEELSNIDRDRKGKIIDKIKQHLRRLENKAERNGKLLLAEAEIYRIEDELKNLTNLLNVKGGVAFQVLDQNLRILWDDVGGINDETEYIKEKKANLVADIKDALKHLLIKNEEREMQNKITDDFTTKQLIKQTEEFQRHWNQLQFNLNKGEINNEVNKKNILEILDDITESITFVINEMKTYPTTPDSVKGNGYGFERKSENEADNLEEKSLTSNVVSEIVKTNFVLDNRNYKKPDLISSEKDLRVTDEVESSVKIQDLPSTNILTEVHKLRSEAKELVKQVNNFDGTNEKEFVRLQTELVRLQNTVKALNVSGSQTISLHKSKAEQLITNGLRTLTEKHENRPVLVVAKIVQEPTSKIIAEPSGKNSVSKSLQDIMDVDANVEYLQKQIQKFEGISKDPFFEKIESGLLENQRKLLSIDIKGYDNLKISKNEIMNQIAKHKKELENKLFENQNKYENSDSSLSDIGLVLSDDSKKKNFHELKSVIEQVQRFKYQIERFSGIYKGIQYKQIEEGLTTAIAQLESIDSKDNEKIENAKVQTLFKIEQYLKILEEKSMKVGSAAIPIKVEKESNKSESTSAANPAVISFQQIESLRHKLMTIKDQVESFDGAYKDDKYVQLENDLIATKRDIDVIQDHGHSSINVSKKQYIEYIDKLLKYFDDKMKISDYGSDFDKNPLEDMREAENELEILKVEVNKFNSNEGEQVLKNIDVKLTELIEKLERIDTGNLTNLRCRKNKMLLDVQETVNLLNDKAQEMKQFPEELHQILREINYVTNDVKLFVGTRYDKKYVELDEALIQLMMRVKAIDTRTSSNIADECVKAIQKIQETMKTLQEKVRIPGLDDKATIVHNLGTFV